MAFKKIVITAPVECALKADQITNGEVLQYWKSEVSEHTYQLHLVMLSEHCQHVLDEVAKRRATYANISAIQHNIDLVIPRPPEEEPEATQEDQGKAKSNSTNRDEIYSNVSTTIDANSKFFTMVVLSAIVAATGLLRDDTAIIIGAMVIAPLLGPNVALALATTLGDKQLMGRSLKLLIQGAIIATVMSVAVGYLSTDNLLDIPAIAARTNLSYSDLVLALASGTAATLAIVTGQSGTLIGVMVAVALMPPLVSAGMLAGSGHFVEAFRAAQLLLANIICVNLAGVLTFQLKGVRPQYAWETSKAKRQTIRATSIWIILLVILSFAIADLPKS
ncbi:TIGR00341 family protein [Echinimonas agarilytica]|uniref:TIGR00341 family protein n=1 Tax=Echinimonas agarilytica TaxID=1215918 RepID=A0AA42B850_9GAMM|nr:TIGR00341 family protein [Echinimonas agarilytica]MCM2680800.1 TIGR00341 family protein [Echinimonas agarilytica]